MKNNKLIKLIIGISAFVAVVGVTIAAVIIFKDEVKEILIVVREWLYTLKNSTSDFCERTFKKTRYTPEEERDFADI